MKSLEQRNQKIIDAILKKEKEICPGAIALIGVYGSFQTGDIHPLSDLDLLILINDERGFKLGETFIQDDLGVGHDIYCTTWEMLRGDAWHPHISKLMDSKVVYCADERYRDELMSLRDKVRSILNSPFSKTDFQKAEGELKEASSTCMNAIISDDINDARRYAGAVINHIENAIALLNKTYFQKGVKRRYEELNSMKKRPENLCTMIEDIIAAETLNHLKERLTLLVKEVTAYFEKIEKTILPKKKPASTETLLGTYEEMFSNWHGKMVQAAESGNRHLAFMSLVSFNEMLSDISNSVDIRPYNALSVYDPNDLQKTREGFEMLLNDYLKEYERIGLKPKRYAGIDAFIKTYLKCE